jgi:dienelactone hydrolase
MTTRLLPWAIGVGVITTLAFWLGWWGQRQWLASQPPLNTPDASAAATLATPKPLPLLAYTIPQLAQTSVTATPITLSRILDEQADYLSVLFFYDTSDGKISGLANFPHAQATISAQATILMLRGWAPLTTYTPGTGTRNGGIYFARHGFVTFAPDFLGYGESDAEPSDPWRTRFIKPLQIKQLIANLQAGQYECAASLSQVTNVTLQQLCANQTPSALTTHLGLWGLSNGGQIALSTLETITDSLPTTLWAPVAVGFPYSVLFFTDEEPDEGTETRKFVALFEEDYEAADFSHTQHLDLLPAGLPLQLHHGTSDDAALIAWADEFATKISLVNDKRPTAAQIAFTYYRYPGADHNLRPAWDTVVARDVEFFRQAFKLN